MKIKKFKDYTPQEKKELLLHWWHYYGKMLYTFAEMEQFSTMIDENANQVMELAIAGFVNGITSQPIIVAMRENNLEELKATLPNVEDDEEFREFYNQVEDVLVAELVETYNNPEPSIPMEPKILSEQISQITELSTDNIIIARNGTSIETLVIGQDPSEYPIQDTKKAEEKVEQEAEFNEKNRLLAIENFKTNYAKAQPIFRMLGYEAKSEDEEIVVYDLAGNLVGAMEKDWTIGGTTLKVQTPNGELSYIVCTDGKSRDNGNISRNIIRLSNLNQIGKENGKQLFEGRYIDIKLGMGEIASSDIPRIEVKVIDPNAENIITEFQTNSYSFYAQLENDFGPYGNYVDGTKRSIKYTDITKNPYRGATYFMSYESVWAGDGHYITLEKDLHDDPCQDEINFRTNNFRNGNTGVSDFSCQVERYKVDEVARQLLKSSRTINLVDYILNSVDTTLPGMRQYIMDNSPLMIDVKRTMDATKIGFKNSVIDSLFEYCRIPQCDLPREKSEQLSDDSEDPTKILKKNHFLD